MPQPDQFDPPPSPLVVSCPKCFAPMRIKTIDAIEGQDRIQFICDECGIEARRDRERPGEAAR